MKKLIAFLICFLMLLSVVSLCAFAEDAEIEDEYYGIMFARWDTLKVDGKVMGTDGQALQYLYSVSGILEAKAETVTVRGWMFCDVEIEGFGYQINDGQPVMKQEFTVEAEQPIRDEAKRNGVDYSERYEINVDVSEMKGMNHLKFLVKLEGTLYELCVENSFLFEFDFHQEGTEIDPTPTPAAIEEGNDPIYIRFNDYDIVEEFFMYATNNNQVKKLEYDDEKNCCVITTSGGNDPNVVLPFYQNSLDDSLSCSMQISADIYKHVVIIGRFDYNSVLLDDNPVMGTFYYTNNEFTDWQEMRNEKYYYEKTDGLQYIKLNFTGNRYYKGQLYDCRFDFFEKAERETSYELYAVCFFANEQDANAFIENYKSNGDAAIPAATPAPETQATERPSETEKPSETVNVENTPSPTEKPSTEKASDSGKRGGCGGVITGLSSAALLTAVSAFVIRKKRK